MYNIFGRNISMQQLRQEISRLLEIQKKERELVRLEGERSRLPADLDQSRRRIAEAEKVLSQLKEDLKHIQVQKKELELESESVLEAISKYERQQFQVKTNVEYQAIMKEIAEKKVENERIEDRILDLMERAEEKERLAKGGGETLARERERLKVDERRIMEETARLDAAIERLKAERDSLLPGVSESVLRKYQRIFANKRDTAVVPLEHYTCGGCHMKLPPQISNNVRKWDELVICENCSRILYWPEGLAQGEEAARAIPSETAGQ